MQKLTFTKSDILFSFWDTQTESWIERKTSEAALPISWYLQYETFIEEPVTVRNILSTLEPYSNHIDLIFVNHLRGLSLNDLITSLCGAKKTESSVNIENMCIIKNGSVKPVKGIEEDQISIFSSMLGLELDEFAETPETSEDILHELTELTTSQILDCPIILDDILEFYYETNPEDTVLEGITNWTLYEVVGAILSDLSTYCFIKGFFSKADDLASSPLTGTELFDYLDTLDNFFNRKN